MQARRARWRRVLEEAARSGLSIRRFCQEHDVEEAQFYAWRRLLAAEQRGGAAEARRRAPDQAARFVLVRPEEQLAAENDTAALELVLERGWRLRIPRGVDEATLRCVLTALAPPA
jgi:transposase-like protein